jgi:hypothetical protein
VDLVDRLPSTDEYVALCASVGWTPIDASDRALEGSLAAVCAVDGGNLVGMGRLVGDGVGIASRSTSSSTRRISGAGSAGPS